jgi:hypothetical protein
MAASDARLNPRRGVAFRVTFPILDADGDLVPGAENLDTEVSLDGTAFVNATNESVEIATASGVYYLDLTAAEMDANTVAIMVKTSSDGAKTTVLVLNPEDPASLTIPGIFDVPIDGDFTFAEVLRIIAAATAGKPVGVGTHTIQFRDLEDSKNVITAVLDDAGNVVYLTFDTED